VVENSHGSEVTHQAPTMASIPSTKSVVDRVPPPPSSLGRLLAVADELKSSRAILLALKDDAATAEDFLRLARVMLPGRRCSAASEAVPLLGETKSLRLALLASCAQWLKAMTGSAGIYPPLLRHSIACAAAAEPLGRDTGIVDPLHAFTLGLLHHVGDATCFNVVDVADLGREGVAAVAGQILKKIAAPDTFFAAIREYAEMPPDSDAVVGVETSILGVADLVATRLGYAAPASLAQPTVRRFAEIAQPMLRNGARLIATVEELSSTLLVDERARASRRTQNEMSSAVLPETLERTSTRDLGPLPALFARISAATDEEALAVAVTAGIVEELGATRAYCLRLDAGVLGRAVENCRGNVPMALPDVAVPLTELCSQLRAALTSGRPVFQEVRNSGLERLHSGPDATAFFAPIVAGKEILGLFGVEFEDPINLLPDLLAAITAHTALALKAVDFKRQSDAARIDELTGLYNRRGILEALDRHLAAPDVEERGIAVALIDCDHLKKVNDNFGHLYGDEYLRRISEVVKLTLRTSDLLGRYGGDEFLAILPGLQFDQAQPIFDRTRERVELAGLESSDGLLLSVSIGVVTRGRSAAGREKLIKLADTALYQVKQEGRNSVRVLDAETARDLTM
jgi:diguanylate cyclase (GGDEF)-like protein